MSFRAVLRPIKRAGGRVIERIWGIGFGMAGHFVRSPVALWKSAGGQKILVVAPHPDDEAIGCVGTILLHTRSADRVCVAIVTDGRRSRVIPDPIEMALQRQREASDAARLMCLDRLAWIGLPEGEWCVPELKKALKDLLAEIRPDYIYAPSRIDFHPEHFKVAHALALALRESGAAQVSETRIRIFQVQVPLTASTCNLVADVSEFIPQCRRVLRAYASQAGSVNCSYRLKRYSALRHGFSGYAEEFWEMPASQYIALHDMTPQQWPSAFRGLRHFPLTDPFAYLVGQRERRRMRASGTAPSP